MTNEKVDGGIQPDQAVVGGDGGTAEQGQRENPPPTPRGGGDVAIDQVVTSSPEPEKKGEERNREPENPEFVMAKWTRRVGIFTGALTLIAILGAFISFVQWRAMLESNSTNREAFEAAQRPNVVLGRPDGTLMEMVSTPERERSAVIVYFHNAGKGPALRLFVNMWTVPKSLWWEPRASPESHTPPNLKRWRNLRTNAIAVDGGLQTLGEGATVAVPLVDYFWLSNKDIAAVERGEQLSVHGTYEYCDVFGNYRCDDFKARYRGSPLRRFTLDQIQACTLKHDGRQPSGVEADGTQSRFHRISPCDAPRDH